MDRYTDMMVFLDSLRINKKISKQELCKDICSTRAYSRYLTGETEVSFDILLKLIERINLSLRDFSVLYLRHIEIENNEEGLFIFNVLFGCKKEVLLDEYQEVSEKLKDKVVIYPHALPVAKLLVEYLYKNKTKEYCHDEAIKIVKYQSLIRDKIIIQESVIELSLFIYLANRKELKEIYDYFLDFIKNQNSYKTFFTHYDRITTIICLSLLRIMELNNEVTLTNTDLKYIYNYGLDFLIRSRQSVNDAILLEKIYQISNILGMNDKYLIFNYVASVLSNYSTGIILNHSFKVTKVDLDIYYEILKDQSYLRKPTYEGIMRL